MHVGDGIIPLWLQLLMLGLTVGFMYLAVKRVNKRFDEKVVPYIGVLAAVIFAAQYVNFPVGPSSGHLVGSTLVSVMVGPWAGMLIIGLVLFVQALYGDGGLLTYGLNFFNMGILSCLVGWTLAVILYRVLRRVMVQERAALIGTSSAAYFVRVIAAIVLGIELLTYPAAGLTFLPSITSIHFLIGIGEAILTFVILLYFIRARPQAIALFDDSAVSELAKVEFLPTPMSD